MKSSGYYWCDNCDGNAGGSNCVACGHPAHWRPSPATLPAELRTQTTPTRRPRPLPRVSDERGHQLFAELRQKLNLL